MSEIKDKLFNDPNIEYPIHSDLAFSEYIHISRDIIAKNRVDLNQKNQHIINANSPFEYRPAKPNHQGILLVHGLFDSPFILQDIGKKLMEAGFLVRAVLLPGHGTVPGALLNVTYEQWLATVRYGIETFKNEVEKTHILGFSLGGALSLMQPNLASYTLLAPVFKIRSMFAPLSFFFKQKAAWFYIDPAETLDYVKYGSVPFNAVYQVYLLTKLLQNITLNAPAFMALPLNDMTVCSKATIDYFKRNSNAKSRMILYTPHLREPSELCKSFGSRKPAMSLWIPRTSRGTTSFDPRILCKTSAYPDLHISDFSHPSIPISPNNSHYGKNGDFSLASHFPTDEKINYGEFSALQLKWNQFALQCRLTNEKYQRLSYNPDFEFLSNKIIDLINIC